jgi:hypothetical protein
MMHTRKIPSILIVASLQLSPPFHYLLSLFRCLPSLVLNRGDSSQDESDTGTDTGAARQDYQEFNTCLTEAEGDEGFAAEDEIRECFQPIYIGGEASQDDESDEGSGDEDNNNLESGDSEN